MNTIAKIFQITFSLIFVLLLIYVFYGINNKRLRNFKSTEVIKVIERLPLSKDTHLLIVTLGRKGYLLASGPKGIEIIDQLTFDEIINIQEEKALILERNKKETDKLFEKLKVKDWLSK